MNEKRDGSCQPRGALWRRMMRVVLAGVTLAPAVGTIAVARAQQAVAPPLAFDNVTVVDVQQGRLLPAQRVVIVGNRIHDMGNMHAVRTPAGARIVDAQGKYLIPGLWDMHTHARTYTDLFYPLFIANGVTGIRDAGSDVPLDTIQLWRREILAGTRVGPPRQLLAGPHIDSKEVWEDAMSDSCPHSTELCVTDTASARHAVDSLKAAGANFIKTYFLDRKMYFVVAAEARRVGIPFGGHVGYPNVQSKAHWYAGSAIEASDSGAGILDHFNTSGDLSAFCWGNDASFERCQPVAERFRRNGTWWVPTLMINAVMQLAVGKGNFFVDAIAFGATAQVILKRSYQIENAFLAGAVLPHPWLDATATKTPASRPSQDSARTDSTGFLFLVRRSGLPLLAGTDVAVDSTLMRWMLPGFTLPTELALYVAEGLTPLEALQTATLNPAKLLHGTDSLGTVAPGKLADLVLLDANPLADIANITAIRAVVANGRYFDRAALDQLIADAEATAKKEPQPLGREK